MGIDSKVVAPKKECLDCRTYTKNPDHAHSLCCVQGYCPAWVDPQETCEHNMETYYYSSSNMLGLQCTKCGLQDKSSWRKKEWHEFT